MQLVREILSFALLTLAFLALFGCTRGSSEGSPQIQPFSFHHGLSFGQKATVACSVNEGRLPLTFEWKKNGEELENSENVRVRNVEDVSILVINPLTKGSAGNYTCVVSNDLGKDEFTASLTIKDTSPESNEPASCEAPSECIGIKDCRFFRNSSDHQTAVELCGPGEDSDRQVCCLNYTLYLRSRTPVYASCQSPSVCIPIIRCLSHRSDPNWQTTGLTCGPGVFALRQICCLGPTLPPRLSRPSKELHCGKSLVSNPLMPIDNNGTSQEGAWPWVVNIEASFSGRPFTRHCTGTLIDQKHVLVTGYCLMHFYYFSNSTYRVRVPNKLLGEDELYTVQEYVIHPLYDFNEFSGDIAILKLHEKIVNPDVHAICLPNEELLNTNIARSDATLAGIHDECTTVCASMNSTMHYSHMIILLNSQCYDEYKESYTASYMKKEDIVCAVIREDYVYAYNYRVGSGGALMIRRGEQWFLVGIYIYFLNYFESADVEIRKPMVFLRISSYTDWIKSVLEN